MKKDIKKTGERIIPGNIKSCEDSLLYLRHLCAYEYVKHIIPQDGIVLDLGFGEGYGTNLLAKHVKKVVGLDIDPKAVSHANNKYKLDNCNFHIYDGENIPFDDNNFDAIISFQVIEHIQEDRKIISEIHRVLKGNSKLIITTPNSLCRLKPGQRPWNRFHIREYSLKEFDILLQSIFSEVTILGIFGNEEVNKIEIERIKQILQINSLDPLNLRKLIPERFKPSIISFLKKVTQNIKKNDNEKISTKNYSINDFYISKNNVEMSLDLLGICVK